MEEEFTREPLTRVERKSYEDALDRIEDRLHDAEPGLHQRGKPASEAERNQVGQVNADFGLFWAGLSPMQKSWAIIGTLFFIGVTIAALDNESSATPIEPPAPPPAQQPAP